MELHWIDQTILIVYVMFAVGVGLLLRSRASRDTEQYFLSGRQLPWWIAGTSMVATSFAIDTPLLVSGWVRSDGIYQNWLWWCYAISNLLLVFFFARWWRRARVTTKAELAELRYGGAGSKILRGTLGVLHATLINTLTLCWVLLAAGKVLEALFDVENRTLAIVIACLIAVGYSLLAGFWGVVMTDLPQFIISVIGAVSLAVIAWMQIDGLAGIQDAMTRGVITENQVSFWPTVEGATFFSAEFWTTGVTAVVIALVVGWWAAESVDGSGTSVQRISASRDERQSTLAVLWYVIAHYALRPWPWVIVALASLIILPPLSVPSPVDGTIESIEESSNGRPQSILIKTTSGEVVSVSLTDPKATERWEIAKFGESIEVGKAVRIDQVLATDDPELAYPRMLELLPIGLLGLVIASLLAAFMSTIDTHVNLAASFFVNDIYRRFLNRTDSDRHYVIVARLASIGVIILGGVFAASASSIRDLFVLFIALLSGLGPIYILRWLWWRIQAWTEIVAMLTSVLVTSFLTWAPIDWNLGPLSTDTGNLTVQGRLLIVVGCSVSSALLSLIVMKRPDPANLVEFYRLVRPAGAWGPVRSLCPDVVPSSAKSSLIGFLGGLLLIFGLLFATGYAVLGYWTGSMTSMIFAVVGAVLVAQSLRCLAKEAQPSTQVDSPSP